MEEKHLAQLYKYNGADFSVEKNSIERLASRFPVEKEDSTFSYWLNFHSIKERKPIEDLGEKLHFDSYAIEDIFKFKKRPKLEEFSSYMFFSVKSALPSLTKEQYLNQEQVSFIVGKGYLISIQEKSGDHFTEIRERIEKNKGSLRKKGSDFLLFRMLEAIIDNYFEVVDEIEKQAQVLEKVIVNHARSHYLNLVELEKRKLMELRKIASPMKDLVSQLSQTNSDILILENRHYFEDLKNSCSTVLDEIDANKQILDGLTNIYYSVQGQKMNEIMKVLTIVSSIFIPITFIAGVYGMNWEYFPELQHPNGYFICLGVMFLVAMGMLYYFIRKGWLKRDKE